MTTPERIVEADGTVNVGWYESPFEIANIDDAAAAHPFRWLGGVGLGRLERRMRRLRLKQWQYTSVVAPTWMFACAIVHAGYLGKVFAYLVDRTSGRVFEWDRTVPLAAGVRIAPNSVDGTTSYQSRGFGRLALQNDRRNRCRSIEANLPAQRRNPPLQVSLRIDDDPDVSQPVVVVEELSEGRWIYTHKCYALPTAGRIQVGETVYHADRNSSFAGIDWNKGYRLNATYWNWAAAAGLDRDGRPLGFNLTSHVSSIASQSSAVDAQDCGLWVAGERVKLPRVHFEYERNDLMKPWRIYDDEGLCELSFTPTGERHEDINLGLVVSQFHQPYGTFTGVLRTPNGAVAELDDVFGVTEQHFARW